VASAVEGVGTNEALFEDLVLITSDVSGIVTRMALLEEKLPLERIEAADANFSSRTCRSPARASSCV
jgi:hypothetical protein